MDLEQGRSKIWLWITLGVVLVLILAFAYFLTLGKSTPVGETIGKVLPFGQLGEETVRDPISGGGDISGSNPDSTGSGTNTDAPEPIFRQLAARAVSGAHPVSVGEDQHIRYIEKETGHAYEVRIKDGATRQLTNTTIPRIYEAYWGFGGNAVILRYLEEDSLSRKDVIKTNLAYLSLPSASSSDAIGTMLIEFLPDNITSVSVSPNGKKLFYLLKTTDGVSGSIVDLQTKNTKEVFRNAFSEWLPELLDTGDVVLTTKPSGEVPGHAYLYSPDTKKIERMVRNKNGLTTKGNSDGSRIFFAENVARSVIFGAYDKKGFVGDEGEVRHENILSITTLPEKCAWKISGISAICAAFTGLPNKLIPDDWYQSTFAFDDTFWSINTNTNEIAYLADPIDETKQEFDVVFPLLSLDEHYFVFINKTDSTLWSMRIVEPVSEETTPDAPVEIPPDLSPEELKDAQASINP